MSKWTWLIVIIILGLIGYWYYSNGQINLGNFGNPLCKPNYVIGISLNGQDDGCKTYCYSKYSLTSHLFNITNIPRTENCPGGNSQDLCPKCCQFYYGSNFVNYSFDGSQCYCTSIAVTPECFCDVNNCNP